MTSPAPLWLTTPTRFAGLSVRRAQIAAALSLALLLACFTALTAPTPPPVSTEQTKATRARDRADVILYENVIAGLRAGGGYYDVAAAAHRTDGYPLKPFFTVRLPTLAEVEAVLPDVVSVALQLALAALTIAAWYRRLSGDLSRPLPRFMVAALTLGGLTPFIRPDLVVFHETWAAPLVALSLACWRPGKATVAIAIALAAMLIRETAALYAGVMALAALVEGRRREVLGWCAAVAVLAAALAAHAWAVGQVVRPDDITSPGWSSMLGFGFFVRTMTLTTSLSVLPPVLAAPLVGVAILGWAAWRDPLGARAFGVVVAYGILLALFCRVDTNYWGLMTAPILSIGFLFVPDAARDLWHGVRQRRRRITVTRTTR